MYSFLYIFHLNYLCVLLNILYDLNTGNIQLETKIASILPISSLGPYSILLFDKLLVPPIHWKLPRNHNSQEYVEKISNDR